MTPSYVRLTRSQVLSVKEMDYITAARVIGSSDRRILFYHILHNVFPPLMILMTINLGSAILAEASLSFLGSASNLRMPPGDPCFRKDTRIFFCIRLCPFLRDSASFWSF